MKHYPSLKNTNSLSMESRAAPETKYHLCFYRSNNYCKKWSI